MIPDLLERKKKTNIDVWLRVLYIYIKNNFQFKHDFFI